MINFSTKDEMERNIWSKQGYYHLAHEASMDTNHPGLKILMNLATNLESVLDLGCGEGTRLSLVASKAKKAVGIDLSQTAIKMAKQRFPKFQFLQADLEKVPLKKESFDLVYSAYVLEHLDNPQKVLEEAISLIKTGGYLMLIAPNYGAPNRASPPFKGSRFRKLIGCLWQDLLLNKQAVKNLNWIKVEPIATQDNYQVDWDTTSEPYLGSLIVFLRSYGLNIKQSLSCWSQELPNAKIQQRLFKLLGSFGLYPFWMWGPHLVVVAQK